jgi:putative flippase GtrA
MTENQPQQTRGSRLLPQLLKFGAVGAVGFIVNFVVLNGLLFTSLGRMRHGSIYATIIATIAAIITNWIGNRYWAFARQRHANTLREGIEFFAVSLAGMGIPILCVWFTTEVLGQTSPLAVNIANDIVGLALGTVFRFALYRWWVFAPSRSRAPEPARAPALASTPDSGLVGDS